MVRYLIPLRPIQRPANILLNEFKNVKERRPAETNGNI